ncbi:MAG TPA: hypothetical protein VF072_15395 [Thermoleophilaceae bacterium]
MRRVARVTEDLGRGGGSFYIEAPDIPEGLTCAQWRRRRTAMRAAALEDSAPARAKRNWSPRPVFRWRPVLRPAT